MPKHNQLIKKQKPYVGPNGVLRLPACSLWLFLAPTEGQQMRSHPSHPNTNLFPWLAYLLSGSQRTNLSFSQMCQHTGHRQGHCSLDKQRSRLLLSLKILKPRLSRPRPFIS